MPQNDDPFAFALSHLPPGQWGVYGPESFQGEYLRKAGLIGREGKTASYISVQSLNDLSPSLRDAQAMVLRLGSPPKQGGTTQFAIVRTPDRLHDFFLIDSEIFPEGVSETYHSEVDPRALFPYYISPRITEKSAVNLALASGLMGFALNLDRPYPTAAPATGSASYTFRFRPHSAMTDGLCEYLIHHKGQVEIDAIFVGRRAGKDVLFVVEAKTELEGQRAGSLAKHKLAYPVLALDGAIPEDMPVVPVYLRVCVSERGVTFRVVQCEFPLSRGGLAALDQLRPLTETAVELTLALEEGPAC